MIDLCDRIEAEGWAVCDLPDARPVEAARQAVLAELRRITGDRKISFATYHLSMTDDDRHTDVQFALAEFLRRERFAHDILAQQGDLFASLLGDNYNVQRRPYLRIARPGKAQDNVGFHRDADYGGMAGVYSFGFPLVELEQASALRVLTGSHRRHENDFSFDRIDNPSVERGSKRHDLGFVYSIADYDPWFVGEMVPVEMMVGQVLIFGPALMHGQDINRGETTRWSTDFCAINESEAISDYFEPLSRTRTINGEGRTSAGGGAVIV